MGTDLARNFHYVAVCGKMVDSFPTVTVDGKKYIAYPNDYAGAYIDKHSSLHVVLVKNSGRISDYQKLVGNDKYVIFDYADFPLSKLYEIQKHLDVVMQEYDIESTEINEFANRIDIRIRNRSKESAVVKYLRSAIRDFNTKSIEFDDAVGIAFSAITNSTTNALAGSLTGFYSSVGVWLEGGTIGFNAKHTSNGVTSYGIVTAGHIVKTQYGEFRNALGAKIGGPSMSQYQVGSTLDAVYVPISGKINPSQKILNSVWPSNQESITHVAPSNWIVAGATGVTKIGNNTGITTGSILSASASASVGGVGLTDQVKISNQQLGGDSGGPILFRATLVNPYEGLLIGIVTVADINAPNYGYASKASNILNSFGIALY